MEFISCPTRFVRGCPCSAAAMSIVSDKAQAVFLCFTLFFFVLLAFFSLRWSDLITINVDDYHPCSSPSRSYDVFISFRGPDTRNGFVSHLFDAMCRAKIRAFVDHVLEKGEEIEPTLSEVIERSKISVVVLSENYASSKWCMEELVKIMGCRGSRGHVVLPVFYGVEPRDVRRQTGRFGSAFSVHVNAPQEPLMAEKMEKWRDALTQVSNLHGYDSDVVRPEAKLVNNIVDDVLNMLHSPGLVGPYSQMIDRKRFRETYDLRTLQEEVETLWRRVEQLEEQNKYERSTRIKSHSS